MDQETLYSNRFSPAESITRERLWRVLVGSYLHRWIPESGCVLDLGAGDCAFINAVTAQRRIALDLNPTLAVKAAEDVETVVGTLDDFQFNGECDVVMASNVFEHLRSVEELLETLRACSNALAPGGRLIVLQPNFKYAHREFYDYLDHFLPLTEGSLSEALRLAGFTIEVLEPRFLPYSAKNQRFNPSWALKLYLRLKPMWWLFGKQMLVVARRGSQATEHSPDPAH